MMSVKITQYLLESNVNSNFRKHVKIPIARLHHGDSDLEVFMIRRAKTFLTSNHSNQYSKTDRAAQPPPRAPNFFLTFTILLKQNYITIYENVEMTHKENFQ